ncbi:MAG TPA: YjgN family protein [Candidatus Methylomirabilis sp.]|nr:YjgN family protein [Candidatus Methylomirabilis sp.]
MEESSPGSSTSLLRKPALPPSGPVPPPWVPTDVPPEAESSAKHRLTFHGSGGTLLGIHIVNVLFTLLTIGVYYCWAKTRVRRYLFSESAFEGDRFAYHGTGKELLLGFLKAFVVFLVPVIVLSIVRDQLDVDPRIKTTAAFLISVLFLIFIPVAMVGSRRYRLTRTSWRGIRFSFRGRAWTFIPIFLKGYFLSGLTFGLYYPFYLTRRQAFMMSNSYFGNERFGFDGRGWELFRSFVLSILLTLPTLGICWIWYLARKRRFFWDHTYFGAARFRSTVAGGALLGLYLVNALLLVLTLGLAWPWVRVRNIRFAFRYLSLDGPLDLERIQQQAQFASATGEGLAGFLDTGFDLG